MKKATKLTILAIETSCDDTAIAILSAEKDGSFDVLANLVASQAKVHKKYGGIYPAMAKREHQKNLVPSLILALRKSKILKKHPRHNPEASEMWRDRDIKNLEKIFEREKYLNKKITPFLKKYAKPKIDLIAVTNGPGLEPCLWVGVNFARALSYFWDIPVVPVNHVESHVLVNFLKTPAHRCTGVIKKLIRFPAAALVVSGGHTQIILMKGLNKYEILGETKDDAAGECFDKCAKILGLGYPGGPAIAAAAAKFKIRNQKSETNSESTLRRVRFTSGKIQNSKFAATLPRPMINTKSYDFSFSGLKTALLYKTEELKNSPVVRTTGLPEKIKGQLASEIQQAIIDVLIKKTIKAAKDHRAKTLILGGGVSANNELRRQFAASIRRQTSGMNLLVPPKNLSTDNALMVAITGYFKARQNKFCEWQNLETNANLRVE